MATDKRRFSVSKTYSIVTPESSLIGDEAESGFELEETPMSLDEVIRELQRNSYVSPSYWPLTERNCFEGIWWTTEEEVDYRTGNTTSYSLHIKGLGRQLLPHQLFRVFRLAKLVG